MSLRLSSLQSSVPSTRCTRSALSTSEPTYRNQNVSRSTSSSSLSEESANVSAAIKLANTSVDLKADRVRQLHVPMYKGLTIDNILAEGKKRPQVSSYLPDDKDIHRLPRQWLVNVIYTLVGDDFGAWVT